MITGTQVGIGMGITISASATLFAISWFMAGVSLRFRDFESLLAPQIAAILEHVTRIWMEGPEAALAWLVWGPGDFHKAVIKRQGMPKTEK